MKYIAFDIGNVICYLNFTGFLAQLGNSTDRSVDADQFLIRLQRPHDLGLATMEEELRAFGVDNRGIKILMDEWSRTIYPEPIMISCIENLIDNGAKVALLSNMGFEHAAQMRDCLGQKIYDNSTRFFSCEVGARKPTMLYYKTFLDMYPDFKGCMYFDDKIENINGGSLLGFNSIKFDLDELQKPENIKQKIEGIIK